MHFPSMPYQFVLKVEWAVGARTGRLHLVSTDDDVAVCGVRLGVVRARDESQVPRCRRCLVRGLRISNALERLRRRALKPKSRAWSSPLKGGLPLSGCSRTLPPATDEPPPSPDPRVAPFEPPGSVIGSTVTRRRAVQGSVEEVS